MLRTADELRGFTLVSGEERLAKFEDLYFDDRFWTVRYLLVDTGGWLIERRVLVSPRAVLMVDGLSQTISTNLTKAQIEKGPSPDEHAPVDRQFEIAYNEYYGYSPYWVGPLAWGANSAAPPAGGRGPAGGESRVGQPSVQRDRHHGVCGGGQRWRCGSRIRGDRG